MRRAGDSQVGVGRTMAGLLPPSSSVTGVRCARRGLHHDAPDASVARVEDVVAPLARAAPASRRPPPSTTRPRRGRGTRATRLRERGRRARRELRGLDHRAVAGGDGAEQRRERQLDRVVPRRDHEHDAERVAVRSAPARAACASGVQTRSGASQCRGGGACGRRRSRRSRCRWRTPRPGLAEVGARARASSSASPLGEHAPAGARSWSLRQSSGAGRAAVERRPQAGDERRRRAWQAVRAAAARSTCRSQLLDQGGEVVDAHALGRGRRRGGSCRASGRRAAR